MPSLRPLINSLNGGELSPRLDARVDINKYASGCRTLQNFIPLVEGGVERMPGTYYAGETKDSTKKSRLIPFHFSTTQAYQLEFGNLYMRIWKNYGQVVVVNEDMTDFSPSSGYMAGVHTKIGAYRYLNFASDRKVFVTALKGQDVASIQIECSTNATDNLSVSAAGNLITILIADTTPAKNAANIIQDQLRALGTVGGVDVSAWTVTENPEYAADRPTAGITILAAIMLNPGADYLFRCLITIEASVTNTSRFPYAYPDYWEQVYVGDPVEITTPYTEAEIFDIDFGTQSADVLYIFHDQHTPAKLMRYSHIDWELRDLLCLASATKVITGITQADPAVVTAVAHGFENGDQVYITGVVGMTEVNGNTYTVANKVANSFDLEGVDSTAYTGYTSGGAVTKRLFYASGKYPACGTLFEQRMALAGSENDPQTINLSSTADYEDFIPDPAVDDAAIELTLVSGRVDRIRWMIGQELLAVGTVGGVWKVGASNYTEPLTQTNIIAKKQVGLGVSKVKPLMVVDTILWVNRSGRTVRQFVYKLDQDKWVAPDITRVAKHITKGSSEALSGIVDMAFQSDPIPILWAVRKDGVLIGMTYEIEEQVYSWFRVVTDGLFESIGILNEDDVEDEVWAIVKRTIGGVTKRYVEVFKTHEFYSQIVDGFFVHCGLTWDGGDAVDIIGISNTSPAQVLTSGHTFVAGDKVRITGVLGMTEVNCSPSTAYTVEAVFANTFKLSGIDSTSWGVYTSGGIVEKVTNSISGLGHLEGKVVDILLDGGIHPVRTVTAAAISLDRYGHVIHVGLPCESIVEPMKLHAGTTTTGTRSRKQRITELSVSLHESAGGKYGVDGSSLYDIPIGSGGVPVLRTEEVPLPFDGDWLTATQFMLVQNRPLPMTILGIVPKWHVSDD